MSSHPDRDMMSDMETDDIKTLISWLQTRVTLDAGESVSISFAEPDAGEFSTKGFDDEVIKITLGAPWWPEMLTDIVETPEYAEPGESPEHILTYAKDVVSEYVRKRLYT